jgi:two-component system chemotaxis response regulator CheV
MSTGLLDSIDRSTHLAGHNRLALLLFRLGPRQIFGINVFKVQEVIRRPALTRMPFAHPLVAGVADIRGRIIPVIDLQHAIGGPPVSGEDAAHVIVAEYNRSVQGFLISAVDRIIHVDVANVKPPPEAGTSGGDGFLTAITRYHDELIEIIDVEKVLAEVLGRSADLNTRLLAEARELNANGLRVLVADDSRVARSQISKVLEQIGVEAIEVPDGREALRYLQALAATGEPVTSRLLMVISDVEMPDMDGYTLTTEIRRDPRLKDLYVLLHTSLSGAFNNAMVKKVGADRFISKFDSDELAQGVIDRLRAAMPVH